VTAWMPPTLSFTLGMSLSGSPSLASASSFAIRRGSCNLGRSSADMVGTEWGLHGSPTRATRLFSGRRESPAVQRERLVVGFPVKSLSSRRSGRRRRSSRKLDARDRASGVPPAADELLLPATDIASSTSALPASPITLVGRATPRVGNLHRHFDAMRRRRCSSPHSARVARSGHSTDLAEKPAAVRPRTAVG